MKKTLNRTILDASRNFAIDRMALIVSFNFHHAKKKSEEYLGTNATSNIEKLRNGWLYERRNWNFSNKMRGFLTNLLTNENYSKLANYLIEGKKPKLIPNPIDIKSLVKREVNKDQYLALETAVNTDSFSLILGMPGTGKTRTICILIDILIQLGKRVLVTSFTHTALDNILEKFLQMYKERTNKVVRMSSSRGTPSERINKVTFNPYKMENFQQLEEFMYRKKAFFTTCMSTGHSLLKEEKFDYVIVDESSQIVEVKLLPSLALAEKFVLIGDYLQLSPIIKSKTSQLRGMGISLLERLCLENEGWVNKLTYQVRLFFFFLREIFLRHFFPLIFFVNFSSTG